MCHYIAMRLNSHSHSVIHSIYYIYIYIGFFFRFFSFFFYLDAFLELQQLNDEIFGHNPTYIMLSKQQRIIQVSCSAWCCQDQLVCPEEWVKVCIVKVFLLTCAAVRG